MKDLPEPFEGACATQAKPILWLHIGVPRTGTTSLQNTFAVNRQCLEALGTRYVATASDRVDANNLIRRLSKPDENHTHHIERIHQQLSEFPCDGRRNYVMSSELMYNRGVSDLFEAFDGFPEFDTRIVVYLRRQDFFWESLYCQMAKSRKLGAFSEYISARGGQPDYAALLASLGASGATIVPRIYAKASLVGGDTVSDFLDLLGLDRAQLDKRMPPRAKNTSLPLGRLELVQELLRAGLPAPARDQLSQLGDQSGKAGGITFLSKSDRRALLAQSADSNEAVREAYFPDHDALFDMSDLTDPAPDYVPSTGFSDTELNEIRSMFSFLAAKQPSPKAG